MRRSRLKKGRSRKRTRLKGEITPPKFFKVAYFEYTPRGYEHGKWVFFKKIEDARAHVTTEMLPEFRKMIKKEPVSEGEYIEIQDEGGESVEAWLEEERKVTHLPKGLGM